MPSDSIRRIITSAKGQGCFEKPEDEARFRVAQALTAGLNIQQASRMLSTGLCANGNTFKWVPARMLIPISEAAHAAFQTPDYQKEVEKLAAAELQKYGKYGQFSGYTRKGF